MQHEDQQGSKHEDTPEVKAGYLVVRVKPGEGVMISDFVEIRLSSIKTPHEAQIAIRAPRDMEIRKIR